MLTAFDYAVFFVLLTSGLIGVLRGLVREILALAGWIFAFWVAYTYSGTAAGWMPDSIPGGETGRIVAGFLLLFLGSVIGAALLSALLEQLLTSTGLKPADRGLGLIFGIARGVVLVLILVVLAGFTTLPAEPFWQDAVTRPVISDLMEMLRPWVPPDLQQYLKV